MMNQPVNRSRGRTVSIFCISCGITPARPLTLEEAKPKIVEALKARKERELVTIRAANVAHDLGEALKAGDPLAEGGGKVEFETGKGAAVFSGR